MGYLIDNGSHIDAALTQLAIKGFAGRAGFIADSLFPVVPVDKQSNRYYIIDPDTYLRIPDTRRSPGAPAKLGEWKQTSDTYFADNYAFGTETPLETFANADLGGAMIRQNNNDFILDVLARDYERRVANIITSISNVGSGVALTGTNKFSDAVGSDPIAVVNTAHAFIRSNTGLLANTMALDYDTLITLQNHPLIRDYVKYTQAGPVPMDQLMNLFRVQEILVAYGILNGAKENIAASMTNIWGNFMTLMHKEPARGMQTATFGLSFRWTPEGFPGPLAIERYNHHNNSRKLEMQEAQYFQDEVIVARKLAYTITGTL